MEHLIVGLGEVGSAIYSVIGEKHNVRGIDVDPKIEPSKEYDVLHICFPYSPKFERYVKEYQETYLRDGGLTIIHSTVPVGTSRRCGAVHSPVRGVHPHLAEGVKTFVKYFGGERANEAARYFVDVCDKCISCDSPETTEAIKLWDTTYYGWNIVFMKELHKWCEKMGLDFDSIYKMANQDYNLGYARLGRQEVIRPVLTFMPGKIGGHCVIQNCEILESPIADYILKANETY